MQQNHSTFFEQGNNKENITGVTLGGNKPEGGEMTGKREKAMIMKGNGKITNLKKPLCSNSCCTVASSVTGYMAASSMKQGQQYRPCDEDGIM